MTHATIEVLNLLLATPANDPLWQAKIGEQTNLGHSTVSQILARLITLEWVRFREEEKGSHPGRPARFYCTLTEAGRRQAEAALAARNVRTHCSPQGPGKADDPTAHRGRALPDTLRPGQANPPQVGEETDQQRDSRPEWRGLWPIRIPDLETLRRSAATVSSEIDIVREAHAVPEHLIALKEALETLKAVNQSLTKDVFARSAADPAHSLQYENIVQAIITETTEIRKRTQRAPAR